MKNEEKISKQLNDKYRYNTLRDYININEKNISYNKFDHTLIYRMREN